MPRMKTKRQHCRHKKEKCATTAPCHRSFINTESCVKASAPSLDGTSFETDNASMRENPQSNRDRMSQKIVQVSPNVNALDRRTKIKTAKKKRKLGRKRQPPERATFGTRADSNVRSAGRKIVKFHKHVFSQITCCNL